MYWLLTLPVLPLKVMLWLWVVRLLCLFVRRDALCEVLVWGSLSTHYVQFRVVSFFLCCCVECLRVVVLVVLCFVDRDDV